MEITVEILRELGFTETDSNMFFPKFIKTTKNPDTFISLEKEYLSTTSNEIAWNLHSWRSDDSHAIIRRVNVTGLYTMEDLKTATDLCGIIF